MPITTRPRRRRTNPWRAVALTAVLALVAGCSSGGDDATERAPGAADGDGLASTPSGGRATADEGSGGAEADPGEASGEGAQEPGSPAAGTVPPGSSTLAQVVAGRSIIHHAEVDLAVPDVADATRRAQASLVGLGGVLFGQDTRSEPSLRTVLTFKVPPSAFAEALARLEDLGELRRQQISADDVTERVVDLQSRITTAEASVLRLRQLLDRADLDQLAGLEGQLLQRETDLELLRGQLRTISDQVELATIVVDLVQLDPATRVASLRAEISAYAGHDGGARCPGTGELSVVQDRPATVCVTVHNTGATELSAVQVRDPGLRLEPDEFTVIGDGSAAVPPGGRLVLWAATRFDPGDQPHPDVSAIPVDGSGPLHLPVRVDVQALGLEVLDDPSLPGFGDAVATGWGAFRGLVGLVVVVAGAALPFLWLVPVGGLLLRWRQRRQGVDARNGAPAS